MIYEQEMNEKIDKKVEKLAAECKTRGISPDHALNVLMEEVYEGILRAHKRLVGE